MNENQPNASTPADDENQSSSVKGWAPDETKYSDWQIIVNDSRTYHVHRVFLAAGPRPSEYFGGLFEKDMVENQSNTSTLQLSSRDAELFPHLLHFFYTGELRAVEPQDILDLFVLADYFVVPTLKKAIFTHLEETPPDTDDLKLFYFTRAAENPACNGLFNAFKNGFLSLFRAMDETYGEHIKPSWLVDIVSNDSCTLPYGHPKWIAQYQGHQLVPRCLLKHASEIDFKTLEALLCAINCTQLTSQNAARVLLAMEIFEKNPPADCESVDPSEASYRNFLADFLGADATPDKARADAVLEDHLMHMEESFDSKDASVLEECEIESDLSTRPWQEEYSLWKECRDQVFDIVKKNWKALCQDEETKEIVRNLNPSTVFALLCHASDTTDVSQVGGNNSG